MPYVKPIKTDHKESKSKAVPQVVVLNSPCQNLSEQFNYNSKTFWKNIPQAYVMFETQSKVVTAFKDLIAGLFLRENCIDILSLALDLSFYAKCSSNDCSFLYQEVTKFVNYSSVQKDDPAKIIVNLRRRGWYDEWTKTPPTTSMAHVFRYFLGKSENDAAISFLGPWLATVLLRFDRKRLSSIINKISRLFNFVYVEDEIRDFPWSDEFSNEWEVLLKRFFKVQVPKSKRNALYRAMIETSYRNDKKSVDALLDFTALQTLEYGGMMLVTMVHSFREDRRSLKLADIVEATRTPDTMNSWITYFNYLTFFGSMSKEEKYYAKFAREFDLSAFENLTYAQNIKLCNYLAVMTDIGRKNELFSESNPGPSYKLLISNRTIVERLTNDDFRFCTNAAEDLNIKECMPKNAHSGLIIARSYLIRAEEYQKLADEASKTVRFQQLRADKFRRIGEEYRRKYEQVHEDGE